MTDERLPTFDAFMNPVMEVLRGLGGSGTIEEIDASVTELMKLTDRQLEVLHNPDKSGQTEIAYRLAWTRTYLKKAGYLENSARRVWALTPEGSAAGRLNEKQVVRLVREQTRRVKASQVEVIEDDDDAADWRNILQSQLLGLSPAAFERLVQRLLRESGFVQVEVTGRSGDGGIDGKGIMRLAGMLSFHVIFQCKRWQSSIGASQIRDFRGSMIGRADKAIFVTTSTFTPDAVREATRDGAPTIDLIDGEQLLDKLKLLGIGVKSELVQEERVTVLTDWFQGL